MLDLSGGNMSTSERFATDFEALFDNNVGMKAISFPLTQQLQQLLYITCVRPFKFNRVQAFARPPPTAATPAAALAAREQNRRYLGNHVININTFVWLAGPEG